MQDDSIPGIFNTLNQCAQISKWAGGIGLHIHNIRAKGTHIRGTNGTSNGIVPMLKVFNHTARYVDQCFSGETIIYTKDGIKRIDEITLNDEVMTHDSTYKKVIDICKTNYKGEIYEISPKHSIDNVRVTGKHPFYVLKNQKKKLIMK